MQNKMHQSTHQIFTTSSSTTTTNTTTATTTANSNNRNNHNYNTTTEARETTTNTSTTTTATTTTTTTTPTTTTSTPTIMSATTASQMFAADQPTPKRPKATHSPYHSKPILLSNDRSSRKRKSISWEPDDKIQKVHYFDYVADERINVTRLNNVGDRQIDANASAMAATSGTSSPTANNDSPLGTKMSNASVDPLKRSYGKNESADKFIERLPWPSRLDKIDYTPELPSPGWNSTERSAQAERETYVLGAIDLPGQPSFVDEPDQQPRSSSDENNDGEKTVPIDSAEGMFVEYPSMYKSEVVNGVRIPSDKPQSDVQSIAPFCNQQSQIFSNQFQQQMVHATQNPFAFQDMGTSQFQPQAQMQIPFPFQQQQQQSLQQQQPQDPHQPVQRFQQPIMPFANQQQQQQTQPQPFGDQQTGLSGPVMPWLSYPFNQVNENSHAHLFRRPAT